MYQFSARLKHTYASYNDLRKVKKNKKKKKGKSKKILLTHISETTWGIFLKFEIWPPLSGGYLHSKFSAIWLKYCVTDLWRSQLCCSYQYTHFICTRPFSWATHFICAHPVFSAAWHTPCVLKFQSLAVAELGIKGLLGCTFAHVWKVTLELVESELSFVTLQLWPWWANMFA